MIYKYEKKKTVKQMVFTGIVVSIVFTVIIFYFVI